MPGATHVPVCSDGASTGVGILGLGDAVPVVAEDDSKDNAAAEDDTAFYNLVGGSGILAMNTHWATRACTSKSGYCLPGCCLTQSYPTFLTLCRESHFTSWADGVSPPGLMVFFLQALSHILAMSYVSITSLQEKLGGGISKEQCTKLINRAVEEGLVARTVTPRHGGASSAPRSMAPLLPFASSMPGICDARMMGHLLWDIAFLLSTGRKIHKNAAVAARLKEVCCPQMSVLGVQHARLWWRPPLQQMDPISERPCGCLLFLRFPGHCPREQAAAIWQASTC